MRITEFILFSFCLISVFALLSKNKPLRQIVACIGLLMVFAHIILQGWRWQMLGLYFLCAYLIYRLVVNQNPLRKTGLFISSAVALISLVLLIALPIPSHSKTSGEYLVGTLSLEISDSDRKRLLPTKLWFPITQASDLEPALWLASYAKTGPALARVGKLPGFVFRHLRHAKAGYQAELDSALATDKPVLLLSHGRGAFKELNTFMALEFASHGYIVIAPDHSKGALLTVLSDGEEIPFDPKEFGEDEGLSAEAKHARVQALGQRWSQDLSHVLEYVRTLKPDLHTKPVLSAGHSTGGGAAIEFCINAADCMGTIGLDTWMEPLSTRTLETGSTKPLLSLFSDPYEEDFEPVNHHRFEAIDAAMKQATIFSKQVVIAKAGHVDFCDAALLSPYSYYFGQEKGRTNAKRVMHIINQHALAFAETLHQSGDLHNTEWPVFPEEMHWVNLE